MLLSARCLNVRRFAILRRGFHSPRKIGGRSYADAITALNSLQSNAATIEAIRKSRRGANAQAIPEMIEWLRKVGYTPHDLDSLNAIHIAGTKGKGSTAAFVSSILSQYIPQGRFPSLGRKIGLYTSPHLRHVRERIQINNEPISEDKFAKYFFEVWDKLEAAESKSSAVMDQATKPAYFRFLTLVAFHTFVKEDVRTAVIECGIGGELDSTNILRKPSATGITSLGIDHTDLLGSTIEEIARHKAGIMKVGVPAFTVRQRSEAMQVLESRAKEKGVTLRVATTKRGAKKSRMDLGLDGDFQRINASLAVELAAARLQSAGAKEIDIDHLPPEFIKGLRETQLAGRRETRDEPGLSWYIDGAHTVESMSTVGEWYRKQAAIPLWSTNKTAMAMWRENDPIVTKKEDGGKETLPPPPRILLFNQQTRAGRPLLQALLQSILRQWESYVPFSHVIFCSNVTFMNSGYKPDLVSVNVSGTDVEGLKVQQELAATWRDLVSGKSSEHVVHVLPTVEEAVAKCREIAIGWDKKAWEFIGLEEDKRAKVLATGSLHLVGGLLEVLEKQNQIYAS